MSRSGPYNDCEPALARRTVEQVCVKNESTTFTRADEISPECFGELMVMAALLLGLGPLTLAVAGPPLSPPSSGPFVLFRDGDADEHNRTWACTRGSSLVRSPSSALLAFFSGMASCADGTTSSALLLRASTDNGTSWSRVRTVHNFTTVSGYVAPVVDRVDGAVLLYFNVNFDETWMRRSADDGATWSEAVNLTAAVGPLALGSGVQLTGGRLALSPHADGNFALLSDDGGSTWTRGGAVPFNGSGLTSGGESQLVDNPARGAHALVMTIRVEGADGDRHHALSTSDDAGAHEAWSGSCVRAGRIGPRRARWPLCLRRLCLRLVPCARRRDVVDASAAARADGADVRGQRGAPGRRHAPPLRARQHALAVPGGPAQHACVGVPAECERAGRVHGGGDGGGVARAGGLLGAHAGG